jgi:hypothetical protein
MDRHGTGIINRPVFPVAKCDAGLGQFALPALGATPDELVHLKQHNVRAAVKAPDALFITAYLSAPTVESSVSWHDKLGVTGPALLRSLAHGDRAWLRCSTSRLPVLGTIAEPGGAAGTSSSHLPPDGGHGPSQSQLQKMLVGALKFARCRRSQGVPIRAVYCDRWPDCRVPRSAVGDGRQTSPTTGTDHP